eukprot:381703_1
MTGGKYGSTIGNKQLANHASACTEVIELSSYLSPDKSKNSNILPRLRTSMAHNRMATRTSSTRSTASQCLTTDVLSVGRAAMATEDNIIAPRLLSTIPENSLLPRKKCNVTREQPSTTSTPFGCDGHEQTLMEQPPSTTSNCGGKQRSLSNRKVERWPTTTLDCTLLPILPEKLKLNGDYEQQQQPLAGNLQRIKSFRGKQKTSSLLLNTKEEERKPEPNCTSYPIVSSMSFKSQKQSMARNPLAMICESKEYPLGKPPPTVTTTTCMKKEQQLLANRKEKNNMVTANGILTPISPEKLNDQELRFRAESTKALKELKATIWTMEEGGEWKITSSTSGLVLPADEVRFDNTCNEAMKTLVQILEREYLVQCNSEDGNEEKEATSPLDLEMEELREFVMACAKAGVFSGCAPCNWVICCNKILNVYRRRPIEQKAKKLKSKALHFVRKNDMTKAIEYYTRAIAIYGDGSKAHIYLLHRATLYCRTRSFEVHIDIQSCWLLIYCAFSHMLWGLPSFYINKRREVLLVTLIH